MCLFGSPNNPAPTAPAPSKAPARLDLSDMEQTPSNARKRMAKGKRGVRNKTSSTGLNMAGSGSAPLSIPNSKKGGG